MKQAIGILIGIAVAGAVVVGGVFIAKNQSKTSQGRPQNETTATPTASLNLKEADICETIPKELVEEAIGRSIVKTGKGLGNSCEYYTNYKEDFFGPEQAGGPHILIGFSDEDYEKIKEDLSRPGIDNQFVKDSRISVEHYLIKSRVGKVWEVDLFLKNGGYLGIKSNYEAVSGEELVKIALKIIEKYPGLFGGEGTKETEASKENNGGVPLPSDEDIIRNFANLIEEGKADSAAKMMKTKDDSELQAWAVQFSNITSFKVLKIEKSREEEWTNSKHYYKVLFDVWMDPRSADAPIPYYGWQNGQNTRWLTLEKVGNVWKIAEIATGP